MARLRITNDLMRRIKGYALDHAMPVDAAASHLFDLGLRALDAQRRARVARWRDKTADARKAAASAAARARWARAKPPPPAVADA